MSLALTTDSVHSSPIKGKIIAAKVKVSANPGEPLPLACALYAIEVQMGIWLCAYYGANRAVFDYLPQQGATIDEKKLGIIFHSKEFVNKEHFNAELWEEFKKKRFMSYSEHSG